VNQKVVLGLLRKLGVQADLVADGTAAVAAVLGQSYDVVSYGYADAEDGWRDRHREIRNRLPRIASRSSGRSAHMRRRTPATPACARA